MSSPPWYAGSSITAAGLDQLIPFISVLSGDQTIDTTADIVVGGMATQTLPAGTYVASACLSYICGASAGTPTFGVHAAPVSQQAYVSNIFVSGNQFPQVSADSAGVTGPTMVDDEILLLWYEYTFTTTEAGTCSFQAHTSNAGDPFTINAGARFRVDSVLS